MWAAISLWALPSAVIERTIFKRTTLGSQSLAFPCFAVVGHIPLVSEPVALPEGSGAANAGGRARFRLRIGAFIALHFLKFLLLRPRIYPIYVQRQRPDMHWTGVISDA